MFKVRKQAALLWGIVVLLLNVAVVAQETNPELYEKIDSRVAALMKQGDIPGLTLVMLSEGKTNIKTFGYADLETLEKVNEKTLFELASCSKAFTALAVEELIQHGKIDPEASVNRYLNDFNVTYEGKKVEVKVKHLLYHTSGIPWNTIAKIPESTADDALVKTVAVLNGQALDELPGTTYQYATINYDVLARIVEKVTGKAFEEYMRGRVFQPLGLSNTTIGRPMDSLPLAVGHKISFFKPRPYDAPRYYGNNAAGYVFSNGKDMARWLKLQLGLAPSQLKSAIDGTHQRDRTVPPHGLSSYAKGWDISLSGNNEISHTGVNPNFTSHVILRPEENVAIAVLANSNSTYTPIIANQAMGLVLGEKIEEDVTSGDNNDGFFSMLAIAMGIFITTVIAYLIWVAIGIFRKKRTLVKIKLVTVKRLLVPFAMVLPFLFGLYILPEATVGFNWESILVWTPGSSLILVKLLLGAIAMGFLANTVGLLFPEKDFYKKQLPKILLFSILSGLSNVLVIIMITSALNSPMELRYTVFYYSLVLLVYLLGRRFVQVRLTKIAVSLVYDMRMKVLSKVLQTSYQKLENMENGRVFTVINDDSNYIGRSAGIFVNLVTSLITIVGTFVYLFSISAWATSLVITMMISLTALYNFVGKSAHKYFEAARDEQNTFMGLINGLVDGLKEISQNRKKKEEYKDDLSESALRYKEKNTIADVKFINGFMVGESLLLILLGIVSMGLSRLFPGISFYTLMSFVIVLLYLIGPINSVLSTIPEVMRVKVSWDRMQKFLAEIPADMGPKALVAKEEYTNKVQTLRVEDVVFTYDATNTDHGTFGIGPINFEVNQGEVLFITGGNGSGKTTLAKILTGLYKPNKGGILINGKRVSNIELSEFFSTVFNPPYLFKKLYGIDTTEKEVEIAEILNVLRLQDKVEITENEFSTLDLSSGQRKRLGLLKCYLEDSPIYLFDEWAADQDPEFRYFFYRTLIPQMKKLGKIVIAISHDDFYFDVADKIVNMREGKLSIAETTAVVEHY